MLTTERSRTQLQQGLGAQERLLVVWYLIIITYTAETNKNGDQQSLIHTLDEERGVPATVVVPLPSDYWAPVVYSSAVSYHHKCGISEKILTRALGCA